MINVNQNYYPMEVWIWNHTRNKSGKITVQADATSVEIPVVCVASTCLYDLPTTPGHAPDEVADVLLRDLLPDLD